ncbi:tetratricopeptide repeat protein [Alcaligenes endophyticus]|uniref:Tetratricopeptide repeat protein n=1 Tax=Alcaligenes endophyticus TaxID=1929088 RepID=A0ABT8EEV1_9BURK|nr:tetratricopeptide repeat protein [Alcaligenes endophyticus]MCX5592342.1 tetratricopeptide repeat protein [Alcaligenes endophyticus]MDN4119785.1 tetratricopeptide repeat protein [Alcaligenes endophyticus]
MNKQLLRALWLALIFTTVAYAQNSGVSVLQEQGKYWQERGDYQRAGEAWDKLLQIEPDHQEALYSLAQAAIQQQRRAAAQSYLDHLKRLAPNSQRVALLEQAMLLSQPANKAALEQARRNAAEGDIDVALPLYREALDGHTPEGEVGMEYYSYLGYQDQAGMEEAIQGLRRLSAASPDDPRIALRLARHLARQSSTRTEGIKMLEQLSARADIGSDAGESWRDSLSWLGSPPDLKYRPLFESYLSRHPDDEEIKAQYAAQTELIQQRQKAAAAQRLAAQRAAAPSPAVVDPYADAMREINDLMDKEELTQAEAKLQTILQKQPSYIAAKGTLGVIRMREGRLQEALSLLGQAYKAQPSNWRAAYASAQYWNLIGQANRALANGETKQAEALFQQAQPLQPQEVAAKLGLASAALRQQDYTLAEQRYRAVLAQKPESSDALLGLVQVYKYAGRAEQADAYVNTLSPEQLAAVGGKSNLQSLYVADLAIEQRKRGDLALAARTLEQALLLEPDSSWLGIELAQVRHLAGEDAKAEEILQAILQREPLNADALYMQATFARQRNDWPSVSTYLSRIPTDLLTYDMRAFQSEAQMRLQIDHAKTLALQGKQEESALLLEALAKQVEDVPVLAALVATAYAQVGDPAYSVTLLRKELGRSNSPDVDMKLAYVDVLLRTHQDVEAASILRSIDSSTLEAPQLQSWQALSRRQTVRQAEALGERGELAAAYDVLAPVLRDTPNDVEALLALAGMYTVANELDKASAIYKKLLQQHSDQPQIYLRAAVVANQQRDFQYAHQAVRKAVALAPTDVAVLNAAAQIYQDQNKPQQAQELLDKVSALRKPPDIPQPKQPVTDPLLPALNPFVGRVINRGNDPELQTSSSTQTDVLRRTDRRF